MLPKLSCIEQYQGSGTQGRRGHVSAACPIDLSCLKLNSKEQPISRKLKGRFKTDLSSLL